MTKSFFNFRWQAISFTNKHNYDEYIPTIKNWYLELDDIVLQLCLGHSQLLIDTVRYQNRLVYDNTDLEVLIYFEAWTKLAQKWLVCASLGIHLEPINKQLMLLVRI